MAADMSIPFLGRLPLDPRIGPSHAQSCIIYTTSLLTPRMLTSGRCCDEGKSFLSEIPDSPAAKAYMNIIDGILRLVCVSLFLPRDVLSLSLYTETHILCSNSKEM